MPRHEEQKTLAYTADELFSVVADVKDYPEFMPWRPARESITRGRRKSSLNSRSGSAHSGKALPVRSRWIDRGKCWCALLKGDRWSI